MAKIKDFLRKQQLTVIFTVIIFLFIFAAMLLAFLAAFLSLRLGVIHPNRPADVVLLTFALISLFAGVALSVVFSRFPLAPIREIMDATDRIANGDYSTRIHLKAPAELKRLSEKFNNMAKELGSVEILRTDFINNFSHEFKTPIASIQGFAEMLELDDLTPEERAEYIHTIIEESSRLTALAANILNLSKIEQQSILTDRTRFNVSEQIRQVIVLLDKKWAKKNITVAFDCGECDYVGNEELLKQVWINLLDNAIKFSPAHETIEIVVQDTETDLVFSCLNKGDPISPSALNHIFDKFYQADTSHATQGNGLGLTIANKIVKLHRGTITVQSSEKSGTLFKVILPKE